LAETRAARRPLAILVVTQYFWPEDFRINELVEGLAARGHHVTVLTSVPNYPQGSVFPAYAANPSAFTRFAGCEVIRVPQVMRGSSRIRLVLNYLSFAATASVLGPWRLRGRRFDAVFVFQTSPVTVGIPGGLLAKLKRARMVMWILDCWPETLKAIGVGAGPVAQAAVGLLVRAIYASADLLLGQSEGFRANVARYGREAKFRHFPNWVESVYAGVPAQPSPLVPPAPPGTFTLCYAGNVGEAQDFPAVLEAMKMLGGLPVRLLVVGDGRDLARTRDAAEAMGLGDRVLFLGRHPPDAMPGVFAGVDALLVSLKADPLFAMTVPGKVQTYLAAGLPILAMLDGEGADVVRNSGAGLAVPAGDSGSLAEAVRRLVAMPAPARAAMAAKGPAFARANYDFNRQLDRLEQWLGGAYERASPDAPNLQETHVP
jgi:glycosyltransferase involved in cell wall biosynthesis